MKLIIAGSRSIFPTLINSTHFDKEAAIEMIASGVRWVEKSLDQSVTSVISGRAIGPDRYGELWCKATGVPCEMYPADWSRGRGGGMERNKQMAEIGDVLLAFWDQKSVGTQHMISYMTKLNKPVFVSYKV